MKKTIRLLAFACSLFMGASSLNAQTYWQQTVAYDITVSLDDLNHNLQGSETLQYTNNSPDTLSFIWIHCWPNSYRDTTTALFRQLAQIAERKTKLKKFGESGYMDQLAFSVDGTKAPTEKHPQYNDILKLILPTPLLPGKKITITTPFFVRIPSYFSRLGHEGKSYMITQWYPKPAVYDRKGWHEMPYLDQGEFFSEYGTYDVKITLPAAYVVGATGTLNNQAELDTYKAIGKANLTASHTPAHYKPAAGAATKTLAYHAENVHDFGWFADQTFYIQYDTLRLPSGKVIDVFSYYRPGGDKEWRHSTAFIKDAVLHYSGWIGEYAYPVVSAVEGPGNASSGGMEYPMITLITSPKARKEDLDGVIAHEVGHNWFYGMLGSNEREHPWMDEGINTFYEFRYEAEKYRSNTMLGNIIPDRIRRLPEDEFLDAIYNVISQLKAGGEPIDTPAQDFPSEFDYGLVVYAQTAVWLHKVEQMIGKQALEKGMKDYFTKFRFKHPYPEDLQLCLEEAAGASLSKLFNLLHSNE